MLILNIQYILDLLFKFIEYFGYYNSINYNIYNYTWINLKTITLSGDYNTSTFKQYIFERNDYNNPTVINNMLINYLYLLIFYQANTHKFLRQALAE